jgi:hypothetical protein
LDEFEYRRAGIYRYSINASLEDASARQSFSSFDWCYTTIRHVRDADVHDHGRTVAFNDKPRIWLQNQKGGESRGKLHRNRRSSHIPRNVAPQILSGHTQRIQLSWLACQRGRRSKSVVAGQKECRSTVFPLHPNGSGLIGYQQ